MSKTRRTTDQANQVANIPSPTRSRSETKVDYKVNTELLFGKKNYLFMLGGVGLIIIGFFLMSGGHMPSPDVWSDDIIYSTTRTLIAPIFILAGLILQFWTIFSKKS